ncbi:MAG: hypothetical protein JNL30_15160 [Rubrivivax sp.]|nr:hypothetical protein [Rubrivivax sp.]
MTIEQVLAALVLAVCLALLVHHFIGAQRQAGLRRWWAARMARVRQAWHRLRLWQRTRQLRRAQHAARAASDAMKGEAAREAADAIERARRHAQRRTTHEAGHLGDDGPGPDGQGTEGGAAAPPIDKPRGNGSSGNVVRPPRFGNRRNDLH